MKWYGCYLCHEIHQPNKKYDHKFYRNKKDKICCRKCCKVMQLEHYKARHKFSKIHKCIDYVKNKSTEKKKPVKKKDKKRKLENLGFDISFL